MTFNLNSESTKFENYENAQYNADNASMHSTSVADEINVIDIYKSKMKSNIKVKKKNLKMIVVLLLLSFCGLLVSSILLGYFLRNPSYYVFAQTFSDGILQSQFILSEMFALSFYAQMKSQVDNNTSSMPSSNYDGKFWSSINSDLTWKFELYFDQTKNDIQNFLQNNSNYHTKMNNSVDNLLNINSLPWKINQTISFNGTFSNFLKKAYITMNKPLFLDPSFQNFNFWYQNYQTLIEMNLGFEKAVEFDMDNSLNTTISFLNDVILFRWGN